MPIDTKSQRAGFTVFFTGLPSAGKSTLAQLLGEKLEQLSPRSITALDGDVVREHLCSDLGFSPEDRNRNIARLAFVAAEVTKAGGIVLVSAIAPYQASRARARALISEFGAFVLVHVKTPVSVCEQRDVKGLYRKAREGSLQNLTGVDDPYETPEDAEVELETADRTPEECVETILEYLRTRNLIV